MSAKRRSAHSESRAGVMSSPTSLSAPSGHGLVPAPGASDPQELSVVLEKIAACRQLPENWDGEDAFPVPEEVASRARDFVARAAEEASSRGLHWQDPAVAPSPEGAIELSWEAGERWALLVILPGQAMVECVTQDSGSPPRSSKVTFEEGVRLALWALAGVPHDAAVAS